jgi:hypothetical protein
VVSLQVDVCSAAKSYVITSFSTRERRFDFEVAMILAAVRFFRFTPPGSETGPFAG